MWLHYPLVLITPHTTLLKSPSHSSDAKLWLPFFLPLSWVVPSCARWLILSKDPGSSAPCISSPLQLLSWILSHEELHVASQLLNGNIQPYEDILLFSLLTQLLPIHTSSSISLKSLVRPIDPCTFPLASALTQSLPSLATTENSFLPTFLNCCPHVLPKTYAWQNSIIPWTPLVYTWSRDCCWGGKKGGKKTYSSSSLFTISCLQIHLLDKIYL